MKSIFRTTALASALAFGLGVAANAATVSVDFASGSFVDKAFVQGGFTFTSIKSGNAPVSIVSGQCIDDKCLNIRNKESIKLTYAGGLFDLLSFYFNTDGNGSGVVVSTTLNGPGQLFSFNQGGQPFSLATLSPAFLGVSELFFKHNDNGTVRIDDIGLEPSTVPPSPVPLPAGFPLLLVGLGGLALVRRRKA